MSRGDGDRNLKHCDSKNFNALHLLEFNVVIFIFFFCISLFSLFVDRTHISLSIKHAASFSLSLYLSARSSFLSRDRRSSGSVQSFAIKSAIARQGGDRWAKGEIAFGAATRDRKEKEGEGENARARACASLREEQISSIMIPGG